MLLLTQNSHPVRHRVAESALNTMWNTRWRPWSLHGYRDCDPTCDLDSEAKWTWPNQDVVSYQENNIWIHNTSTVWYLSSLSLSPSLWYLSSTATLLVTMKMNVTESRCWVFQDEHIWILDTQCNHSMVPFLDLYYQFKYQTHRPCTSTFPSTHTQQVFHMRMCTHESFSACDIHTPAFWMRAYIPICMYVCMYVCNIHVRIYTRASCMRMRTHSNS